MLLPKAIGVFKNVGQFTLFQTLAIYLTLIKRYFSLENSHFID